MGGGRRRAAAVAPTARALEALRCDGEVRRVIGRSLGLVRAVCAGIWSLGEPAWRDEALRCERLFIFGLGRASQRADLRSLRVVPRNVSRSRAYSLARVRGYLMRLERRLAKAVEARVIEQGVSAAYMALDGLDSLVAIAGDEHRAPAAAQLQFAGGVR